MAVGEDFAKFNDGYNIDATLISSISYRYKRITRQLNKDFWNTDSDTAHSLYVGSYGRDTAAKGVSDLDIAFELPNSEYHKYNAYRTNGQSALLQAVKRSMQNTYPSSDTSGDGQVVVVEFTDNIKFEVLPVFENKDKQTFTFPNANNGGSWRICNPREEIAAIKKRNDATNGNMKHLARMMRVWRDHCAVPMGGWLIDTLAYQFIETYEHCDKSFLYHDWMSRDFFELRFEAEPDPVLLAGARQRLQRAAHRRVRVQGSQRISTRVRGDPTRNQRAFLVCTAEMERSVWNPLPQLTNVTRWRARCGNASDVAPTRTRPTRKWRSGMLLHSATSNGHRSFCRR